MVAEWNPTSGLYCELSSVNPNQSFVCLCSVRARGSHPGTEIPRGASKTKRSRFEPVHGKDTRLKKTVDSHFSSGYASVSYFANISTHIWHTVWPAQRKSRSWTAFDILFSCPDFLHFNFLLISVSYGSKRCNLSNVLFFFAQPTSVIALVRELSRKRDMIASTPRRQCLLHPGPRGDPAILGKVVVVVVVVVIVVIYFNGEWKTLKFSFQHDQW